MATLGLLKKFFIGKGEDVALLHESTLWLMTHGSAHCLEKRRPFPERFSTHYGLEQRQNYARKALFLSLRCPKNNSAQPIRNCYIFSTALNQERDMILLILPLSLCMRACPAIPLNHTHQPHLAAPSWHTIFAFCKEGIITPLLKPWNKLKLGSLTKCWKITEAPNLKLTESSKNGLNLFYPTVADAHFQLFRREKEVLLLPISALTSGSLPPFNYSSSALSFRSGCFIKVGKVNY